MVTAHGAARPEVAGLGVTEAVHVQGRASKGMAAAWQEHTAAAGLWNKKMSAAAAARTARGAVAQGGEEWQMERKQQRQVKGRKRMQSCLHTVQITWIRYSMTAVSWHLSPYF